MMCYTNILGYFILITHFTLYFHFDAPQPAAILTFVFFFCKKKEDNIPIYLYVTSCPKWMLLNINMLIIHIVIR